MSRKLIFSTKAKTLEDLSPVINSARVLPLMRFCVEFFRKEPLVVVSEIRKAMFCEFVAIRSSAAAEDSLECSNAGHFKSCLDISLADTARVIGAINSIIESYGTDDPSHEVFVQPMLTDIKLSGVVFTADIDTLAPYYIINFDESGSTDLITSGRRGYARTYIHFKGSDFESAIGLFGLLFKACEELERIFNNHYLDIEFAFDHSGELYILQVRPIVVKQKEDLSHIDLKEPLRQIYHKIKGLSSAHPNLFGDSAIFGVMPDWNPAEMIGLKPKQLALSLYKELITDSVWAYQRDNYGYRNLRSHPLLISFLGVPYIDVRVDFNSFIPKDLNETTARKLAEYYLYKLDLTPAHHDKIEFEVVHSCYYLNLPEKLKVLSDSGFQNDEIQQIEDSLLELTNNIIDPIHGLYKKDIQKIELLKEKYDQIMNSTLPVLEKIYWLIEDCKRYGTLPFAGIARAGFIAVQFLKSFVEMGIMTQHESEAFMNSVNTIGRKLKQDLSLLSKGQITSDEFLDRYGHLRPGSYDIMSQRYDENFKNYFFSLKEEDCDNGVFEFSRQQMDMLNRAFEDKGLNTDADKTIRFIREAIEGREYAKFVFTKSLSQILRLIEQMGKEYDILRDDLAYLDVRTVLNAYSSFDHRSVKTAFIEDIQKNKEFYTYTKAVKFPSLIRKPEDIYTFFIEEEEPNFITLKRVSADVACEESLEPQEISGKIVFIRSADPGYDYLFSNNIAGLVTQFGGANSHMAIRCAELGIPAIIGAGEKNFSAWANEKTLDIDCANKKVRVVLG